MLDIHSDVMIPNVTRQLILDETGAACIPSALHWVCTDTLHGMVLSVHHQQIDLGYSVSQCKVQLAGSSQMCYAFRYLEPLHLKSICERYNVDMITLLPHWFNTSPTKLLHRQALVCHSLPHIRSRQTLTVCSCTDRMCLAMMS